MEHLINHIAFLLDASGSMAPHRETVEAVFNSEVKSLRDQSVNMNQETRVSLFSFDSARDSLRLKNHFFDIDVMRVPTLTDYVPATQTPLYDATIRTWQDLSTISQIHGNHAFLYYVITDGEENASQNWRGPLFKRELALILEKNQNLTLAALAPNATSSHALKLAGFPNVEVWDTNKERGFEEVGETVRRATSHYMQARSTGSIRVSNVFGVDTSNVSTNTVRARLVPLSPSAYKVLAVRAKSVIQPFVESWKMEYRPGSCYYELTKRETLQPYKELVLLNRKNGEAFHGHAARAILGLPTVGECRIEPTATSEWDVFVQSTSYNRNLMPGTRLIVMV